MSSHPGLDEPGHPGAGAQHLTDDHGGDHGHDDHAHAEEPLGPVDVARWAAGAVGIALGAVIALCFALATAGTA